MEIKINKEVRNYTESIFFGLSTRQFIYAVLACIVAIGIYFSTIDKFGMEVTSWLCILGAAPFASIGFITFQSMNMEKIIVEVWKSYKLKHTQLIDQPTNIYYEMIKPIIQNQIKENLKKDVKNTNKIQKAK